MPRQSSNWTASINDPQSHAEIRRLRKANPNSVGPEYLLTRIVTFCTDDGNGGLVAMGDLRQIFSMVTRQTLVSYVDKLVECGALVVREGGQFLCTVAKRICEAFNKKRTNFYTPESGDNNPCEADAVENEEMPWEPYLDLPPNHESDSLEDLRADMSAEGKADAPPDEPQERKPPYAPKHPATDNQIATVTSRLEMMGVSKKRHEVQQLWDAALGREHVMLAALGAAADNKHRLKNVAGYVQCVAQAMTGQRKAAYAGRAVT